MKIRISASLNSKAEHKAMETEALTTVGAELLQNRQNSYWQGNSTKKKISGTHQSRLWQHFLRPSERHQANSRRHHRDLGEIKLYWALQTNANTRNSLNSHSVFVLFAWGMLIFSYKKYWFYSVNMKNCAVLNGKKKNEKQMSTINFTLGTTQKPSRCTKRLRYCYCWNLSCTVLLISVWRHLKYFLDKWTQKPNICVFASASVWEPQVNVAMCFR